MATKKGMTKQDQSAGKPGPTTTSKPGAVDRPREGAGKSGGGKPAGKGK